MRNFWLVAKAEYLKKVTSKGFWLASLSLPLLIGVLMAVIIFFALKGDSNTPLGYVDQAGILKAGAWQAEKGKHVRIQPYPDEAAARQALERGEIQGYYMLPADFLTARDLHLFYKNDEPGVLQRDDFTAFLRLSLAAGAPEEVRPRLVEEPELIIRTPDGSKEVSRRDLLQILLPFVAGIVLVLANMGNAGTLLQVVADEKESRTIEILLTSLSPEQLIGGKVLGLLGVAFTQMGMWTIAAVGGVAVGAQFLESLQSMRLPWGFLLLVVAFFVPTFAMVAGVMTAIGGSVTEVTQGQQIAGVLNLFFMLPLMLSAVILLSPDSPVVVFMTLFPTTSFATIALRWGYAAIPFWQLAAGWILLVITALTSVWASARIFRLGMLRFGSPLDLRTALSSLRGKA